MINESFLSMSTHFKIVYLTQILTTKYNKEVIISKSPVINLTTGEDITKELSDTITTKIVNAEPEFKAFTDDPIVKRIECVYPDGYDTIKSYIFNSIEEFFEYISKSDKDRIVIYYYQWEAVKLYTVGTDSIILRFRLLD